MRIARATMKPLPVRPVDVDRPGTPTDREGRYRTLGNPRDTRFVRSSVRFDEIDNLMMRGLGR